MFWNVIISFGQANFIVTEI